jgi:hypothetical protein
MKKWYFLVLFVLEIFSVKAQILNIEKFRLDYDTSNYWLGNVGFTFANSKQNSFLFRYTSTLNLAYLTNKHSYMTINNIRLDMVDKKDILNEGYTHWRINFFRHQKFSPEPYCQFQYAYSRGLDYRQLLGFSLRMNLLKKVIPEKKERLDAGFATGVMYEVEKWTGNVLKYEVESDSTKAYANLIKSSSYGYLKFKLGTKITCFLTTYYQARWDQFLNKHRIVIDYQFMYALSKSVNFSFTYVSILDNSPVISSNRYVHDINSGLVIKIH